MPFRIALCLIGLLSLSACQNAQVTNNNNAGTSTAGLTNPIAAISAESCKSTFESYTKMIEANAEKYENEADWSIYPEVAQYSQTLHDCMEKGYLSQADMMKVMEKVVNESEAMASEHETEDHGETH